MRHALWLGRRTTWLGVWERNDRAIRFYARHGYERCGEHVFQLGDDAQTDYIMQRLQPPPEQMTDEQYASFMLMMQRALGAGGGGKGSSDANGTAAVAPVAAPSFTPLPATAALRDRVLHALSHAPATEAELQHGCSLLQVATFLRCSVDELAPVVRTLQEEGFIQPTIDDQHFRPTQ